MITVTKHPFKIFLVVFMLCMVFVTWNCGKIGDPKVPSKLVPSPVTYLKGNLLCEQILLTWTRPFTNTDGTVLEKIKKIEIYREIGLPGTKKTNGKPGAKGKPIMPGKKSADKNGSRKSLEMTQPGENGDTKIKDSQDDKVGERDIEGTIPEIEEQKLEKEIKEKSKYFNLLKKKIYTFNTNQVMEILAKGDKFQYQDDGEDLVKEVIDQVDEKYRFFNGYIYKYSIIVYGKGDVPSKSSSPVSITYALLPDRVRGLKITTMKSRIFLTWQPVETFCNGKPLDNLKGYYIYRSMVAGSCPAQPVNNEPLQETIFTDENFQFDKVYYYYVRAVLKKPPLESYPSEPIEVMVKDVFPPGPPGGFSLVKGIDRINLVWTLNEEKDLAGYNVYRSKFPGQGYKKLNDQLVTKPFYSDVTVKQGITYYYVITAVDNADPPNESGYSIQLSTSIR